MTNLEENIKKFCNDAVELTLSLNGNFLRQFKNNSSDTNFDYSILNKISLDEVDVHRSIISLNGDLLFVIDIDHHADILENQISKSLKDARHIEASFPGMFLWVFTGGGIHGVSYIRYNKRNEKYIKKYGYVFDFYKALIDFINRATGKDLEKTYVHYRGLTRALGSLHSKHGLHAIPIDIKWEPSEILQKSKNKIIVDWEIPDLNLEYLSKIVPISNYNFKTTNTYQVNKKVKIEYDKYPPCIKKLFSLKDKGNMERFEILRYLFSMHQKYDALNFIRSILTEQEFTHAKDEGQMDYILSRQYPPPTCGRLMKMGLCMHCNRPSPCILKNDEEN